jgi:nucleoside-diphosphate-sugar epimerase
VIVGSTEEPADVTQAPGSPYGAAKAAASLYCRTFHELYRVPVVVVRPAMTYGPHQNDQKLLPYVIRCAVEGCAPELTSGTREADWIFVDDLIDGFMAATSVADVEGMTFELGTGHLRTTRSIVEELLGVLGDPVVPLFGAVTDRPGEVPRAALVASAREYLGWSPRTSSPDGLRQTANWYVERFTKANSDLSQSA